MQRLKFSSIFAVVVFVLSILAYLEETIPHRRHQEPTNVQWVSAAQRGLYHAKVPHRVAPPVDGMVDLIELGGKQIKNEQVYSNPFNSGLELAGWMVLEAYRRPLFRPDALWATLYNDEHRYDFLGLNVDRQDIAQLFDLPSTHVGFRFRMDLTGVAPGSYRVRIQRPCGSITPNVRVFRS